MITSIQLYRVLETDFEFTNQDVDFPQNTPKFFQKSKKKTNKYLQELVSSRSFMIIFDQTCVDKVMKFLGPGLLGLESRRFTPWNEKQRSHWMHVTESWN